MIDKDSIEQLKNNIDIVDIVSNYIELKKNGANFKANCPFHEEKTASFFVSPTKQIFHCFGCSAGGDAIKFVQEYEKLNYPEAIEKIASIMNFTLNYTDRDSSYFETKRVLEQVQKWYRENLKKSSIATDYLLKRGVSTQSIEDFGIGYVGKSNELMRFLSDNFLPIPEAEKAGVVAKSDNSSRFYARLTERITFPIHSPNGSLVGFGGRTITNHPAKYINSPQTQLFNKSKLLYGYSKARKDIFKEKKIIICEGYLDVIMLHQAGFKTAVATLGTALTADHIPILKKGEPEIILAYDSDKAGIVAGLKASIMLSERGINGSIVLFPNGADPADMIADGNIEELKKLLNSGRDVIKFSIEKIAKAYNLDNPAKKKEALSKVKNFLNKLSPIIREDYQIYASSILGVPFRLINNKKMDISTNGKMELDTENMGALIIIKTVAQNSKLLKKLIDTALEPSYFKNYAYLLDAVINGKEDEPNLIKLLINDEYASLSEEEFEKVILNSLIICYRRKRKIIESDKNLSIIEKNYLYRKISTDIIPRLRMGKIVRCDELKLPSK